MCDVCGKNFGRKGALRNHLKIHAPSAPPLEETERVRGGSAVVDTSPVIKKTWKCDFCDKTFVERSLLKPHMSRCGPP